MPLSSAQAEARPSLALSTLDLVSPSQVQCLESLLAPMTSAGKKKKNQSTYTFFKALGEVRSPSYRSPGQRVSTLQIFSLPMEGSCYRAGERRRRSSEGEVSLLKPEDKQVPITQSWFLQNMRATD